MNILRREKKDEDAGGAGNMFASLDKTTVLQETRAFNETPVNTRKCSLILTKLLYLLNQGETFGRTEATQAFFSVTKLWQSKDATLRRLLYLAIIELSTMADDVIIVTSSLTKDMTGKEDLYRPASIRALCCITDAAMLQAIDRYMKQAIVDKVPSVSSAALVSAMHLMKRQNIDVVRRWANEVQEAVNSDNYMVQFHALAMLYNIRKGDRLAVDKMVQKYSRQALRSPFAVCYLIRIAAKMIDEDDSGADNPLFGFIEACLRHKTEIVTYEAASALVNMRNQCGGKELQSAVSVLQLFCSSPRPALRFAAVRTLNKVAISQPQAVAVCNGDLEALITDQNRSIATLAITTLLKTGAETSVDRLMKQISTFVSEISDEFKIVVIEAIQALCMRYPRKHAVMMNFLSNMLRDDGGFEYKRAIVDTIITIIEENPESKETALLHLCEFIEDCEHFVLATRILHLLGREGPRSQQPARYIRFIYNRVILEPPVVRAAAVSALAKFGAQVDDLRRNIIVLLRRCLLDSDDEVRDRAAYYLTILEHDSKQLTAQCILSTMQYSIVGLERALQGYLDQGVCAEAFDLNAVPLETQADKARAARKRPTGVAPVAEPISPVSKKDEPVKATRQDVYAEQLAAIPEFSKIGPLFKSNDPVELTEAETEYNVVCVKHMFPNHVVLQFDVRNTLSDQQLEKVWVSLEPTEEGFEVERSIPAARVVYNQPTSIYALIKLPEDPTCVTCNFTATLKFVVRDCDPNTGEPEGDDGYPDEYLLEDVEVSVADHIQRVLQSNFAAAWDEQGETSQTEDTYALGTINTIDEAVKQVVQLLGMSVCERSDRVPAGKTSHALLLSGVYRGGVPALVRARMALTANTPGVTLNFAVRCPDETVTEVLFSVIG